MPPLGWRKSVDGAKGKGKQSADLPVYNNPPSVPERTGTSIVALGGTSLALRKLGQRSRLSGVEHEEADSTMEVDNPSENSTLAPGSVPPQGSSSDHTSNTGMTPPIRSIKLKLKMKPAVTESPPPEQPAPTRGRGRGRGGRARGGRGRGRGGRARKIVALSPPSSSEEDSPPEAPAPPESDSDSSNIAPSELQNESLHLNSDEEQDDDQDAEAEIDPDTTGNMDEDIDELDAPGEIDPDLEDEMEDFSFSAANASKLTARQAALVGGGNTAAHVMLPEAPSRRAQKTEAEIALRRSETARKRKHQDAQRLEDEKTETINRLLKKQSVKARNKKALENLAGETAAGDETGFATPDNRSAVPCYRWVSSSASLTFSLPDVSNSPELVLALETPQQPTIRPPTTCAISGCDLQRKYRLPGAPNFETGACGMEHLKLLKTQ